MAKTVTPKTVMGTWNAYPALADLPALVRKQRTLEGKLVPLKALEEDEKAVRAQIDALLVAAGVDLVTCAGYDVTHHHRDGRRWINGDLLAAAGVADETITLATVTGDPWSYATVKPSKGAKVRTTRAA